MKHEDKVDSASQLGSSFGKVMRTFSEYATRPDAVTKANELGGLTPGLPVASFSGRERNILFRNVGDGKFANIADAVGAGLIEDSRGFAFVDPDGDGDLDIAVHNFLRRPSIYLRNEVPRVLQPIVVRLRGTKSNRQAVGARVTINGLAQTVACGSGYVSQSTANLHFGVPAGAVKIAVRWPAGGEETFEAEAGQVVTITEGGKAEAVALKAPAAYEAEKLAPTVRVGDRFPAFKGRKIVGLFSGTCGICRVDLATWGKGQSGSVEWLCVDASDTAAKAMLEELGIKAKVTLVDRETRRALGDVATPTYLVLDDEGKVVGKYSSDRALEDATKKR